MRGIDSVQWVHWDAWSAYLEEHHRLLGIFNVTNSIIQVALYHVLQNKKRQVTNVIPIPVRHRMDPCSMSAQNEVQCHATRTLGIII
jgi:hypothetical protein